MSRSFLRGLSHSRRARVVAPLAAAVVVGALLTPWGAGSVGAAPALKPAKGITPDRGLSKNLDVARPDGITPAWKQTGAPGEPGQSGLEGVPTRGPVALMIELDAQSTGTAYQQSTPSGKARASAAAKSQLGRVRTMQGTVERALPSIAPGSRVLYRSHSALPGVAVVADAKYADDLKKISGVKAVHAIVPKSASNAAALPLMRAPQAWQSTGSTGEGVRIGIIDTGIDYTHAGFGGPGTVEAFEEAAATSTEATSLIGPGKKVAGGMDFAGDDYNADPSSPDFQPVPHPDPNPLDCNGHGSHVAGSAAGFGVTADGATFTGPYDQSTPFSELRIGPGTAPEATLYGLRVFGCEGSTNVVGEAIDWAVDPNGDGDPSDHLDVINLSLGSDFGYPTDADSMAINRAAEIGVMPVLSAGNGGDLFDVGGSPGNAVRGLGVAATDDGQAVVDGLQIDTPADIAGDYPGELSVAYDYRNLPGVTNAPVSERLSEANADGCDPLSAEDQARVTGKVAFLEWTDDSTIRRCGSAVRSANVRIAGATGFIFANDANTFAAGITGDAQIPGMLITKDAGDAIRGQLGNGVTATITGAKRSTQKLTTPETTDMIAGFTSRSSRGEGNVKPDVGAPGLQQFSVSVGTGNEGAPNSGTSMASPLVAGLAALVRGAHPDWTPEQVKADIMNTATNDLFRNPDQTDPKYGPNRVGAGRVNAQAALSNEVLAYVVDDPGAVSVSFGSVEVTGKTTLTKRVRVQNTGNTAALYHVRYEAATKVAGVKYETSVRTLTVGPRQSREFTVSLKVTNPKKLTKTLDPTMDRTQLGLPRYFLADATGRIVLTPSGGSRPELRVPVYSAPRPASTMTQDDSVRLRGDGVSEATLRLSGKGVRQGRGVEDVTSIVSGYELLAQSGQLPTCSGSTVEGCVLFPDERSVDLKNVGVASDVPANGLDNGFVYFAVNTWGAWRAPVAPNEFDILIDTNNDDVTDAILFTARITDTDLFFSALVDGRGRPLPSAGNQALEPLNVFPGDVDTDIYDSDVMIIPVPVAALPNVSSSNSRIRFSVLTFDFYHNQPMDTAGLTATRTHGLTVDLQRPGIQVGDPGFSFQFFEDSPGTTLRVRRDGAAYTQDGARGVLMVHQHNRTGSRAQVVSVQT